MDHQRSEQAPLIHGVLADVEPQAVFDASGKDIASSSSLLPEMQLSKVDSISPDNFGAHSKELRHLGSIYTPREIADYLVAWAIQKHTTSVMDLGVGNGVFVWSAYDRLRSLGAPPPQAQEQIYGAEVYEPAYWDFVRSANEQQVAFPNIVNADFLSHEFPKVDAIIGNPPYVRRQYIDDIERVRQSVYEKHPETAEKLSRMSDLYVYFLLRAAHFLKEGGRLSVVVADAWMGVNYGKVLKDFLTQYFEIDRIISFDRRIFNVDVKPVILMATKRSIARKQVVEFIRVKNGLSIDFLDNSSDVLERHRDINVKRIPQDTLNTKQIWHTDLCIES